jgi:hypothetical protein
MSSAKAISIAKLKRKIASLPSDQPRPHKGKWYRTQHQHRLGWLNEYSGPGAYGRFRHDRDAEFAYNHIVESKMLLWLIEAASAKRALVRAARAAARRSRGMARKSAAVRRHVPWSELAGAPWGEESARARH